MSSNASLTLLKIQKYGHVTCIYLQTTGEKLYPFDDVLNIFFDRTNWSSEVKLEKSSSTQNIYKVLVFS